MAPSLKAPCDFVDDDGINCRPDNLDVFGAIAAKNMQKSARARKEPIGSWYLQSMVPT